MRVSSCQQPGALCTNLLYGRPALGVIMVQSPMHSTSSTSLVRGCEESTSASMRRSHLLWMVLVGILVVALGARSLRI